MRFKLDENLPRRARGVLEAWSWDVHDVHEEGLTSALDSTIREACEREDRILVTLDTDFSDVRRRDLHVPAGTVLLRPRDQSIPAVLRCLEGAVRALQVERIRGALWMVEEDRLRIRVRGEG